MDQEDDQFSDDVEFPSSSVVVEADEVEVVADEVQDDAEVVEGVIEPDVNRGREVLEQLPTAWTTPEWEVFLFLGAAGRDEAHLRPAIGPAGHLGGSTRPPQRRATKRRARSAAVL